MASKKSYTKLSSIFDEQEWVIQIRSSLEEEIEDDDMKTPVSVFCVPKELVSCKPEAYAPQLFAFGPYHHWQTHLYDMERYKLASARRVQALLLDGLMLHGVVAQFMKHEYKIRCHYHKYLDFSGETLIWMMVIDACFLLEFLQNHAKNEAAESSTKQAVVLSRTLSKRIEHEKTQFFFNLIVRDIMMLENQMPLFLLRKLTKLQNSSKEPANEELFTLLSLFVNEVSPFKNISNSINSPPANADDHPHLLALLYSTIVPKSKAEEEADNIEITEQDEAGQELDKEEEKDVEIIGDTSQLKKVLNCIWGTMSNTGLIKRVIVSKPVMLLVKLPWKVISAIPILSIMKQPIEGYFSNLVTTNKSKSEDESGQQTNKPPLAEEIAIPSVTELYRAGVKFLPTNGDVTTIEFDTKIVTMRLPVISLDVNTEIVLRNLVAYEASAVSGPLVFTRYTELMCGIIDTEEDVRILRGEGVVVNRMKSDEEAARLWNGMSKSVRLTKVIFLDKVIRDVNRYYRSRWKVKCREFMKIYVFGSWQVLTFLAAALLLFMTCVQSFCSVYNCSSHVTKISSMGD